MPEALDTLSVLVVEDNEDDGLLLVRHLARAGYAARHVRVDTKEALVAALGRNRFDLVLCDYTLPKLSVFEAIEIVRQADPDMPLIVVTGSMGEDELVRLIKFGAKDIILKNNLVRLKPAIDRELAEANRRRRGRENEVAFIDAIESTSEGLALYNENDRLVLRNGRYAEFLGPAGRLAVAGADYAEILHEAVLSGHFEVGDPRPERVVRERLDARRGASSSHEQPLSDGRWLRITERRTGDHGTIAVVTEITERRRREERLRQQAVQLQQSNEELQREIELRRTTEASLRESGSRLHAILEGAADGVMTVESTGAIESANSAAERIFGSGRDDLLGRDINTLIRPALPRAGGPVTEGGPRLLQVAFDLARVQEMTAYRLDGSTVPVELMVSEARLDDRSLLVLIVRDISERAELDRMKREFVSVVSHELRTPLTAIKGSLRLLQASALGELPAPARPIVDMATRNSERLIRLIDDILDIEKVEVGKMEFAFQPLALRSAVEAAIRDNRPFAEQMGTTIELDEDAADATIYADPHRLQQVITNLLSNAAKFSPPGGAVRVGIAVDGDIVRTSVRDSGDGIPEALQKKIFEKFVQVDSSDTRRRGGTGLGLSISQAIVERHGGRIAVTSKRGVGTTFYFDLPGWRGDQEAVTADEPLVANLA